MGYATHGLLDACTSYGTLLFWPFSNERVTWNNISIVDPIFTIPVLILIGAAIKTKRKIYSFFSIGWIIFYLSLGFIQYERALSTANDLAESRGHIPERLTLKPSFGNLILWKSIYEHEKTIYDDANLVEVINNKNYDFSISFYSSFVTAYKLWLSNIPKRYAPATKLAQMFHNKKIKQNRSLSLKSEYEYNNALAKFFLKDNFYKVLPADNSYISLNEKSISSNNKILIFIHPFTGGSSKTLSGDDFIQLCFELDRNVNCKFILHCASDDYVKCQKPVSYTHLTLPTKA